LHFWLFYSCLLNASPLVANKFAYFAALSAAAAAAPPGALSHITHTQRVTRKIKQFQKENKNKNSESKLFFNDLI